jgi:hypothetical protein
VARDVLKSKSANQTKKPRAHEHFKYHKTGLSYPTQLQSNPIWRARTSFRIPQNNFAPLWLPGYGSEGRMLAWPVMKERRSDPLSERAGRNRTTTEGGLGWGRRCRRGHDKWRRLGRIFARSYVPPTSPSGDRPIPFGRHPPRPRTIRSLEEEREGLWVSRISRNLGRGQGRRGLLCFIGLGPFVRVRGGAARDRARRRKRPRRPKS